MPFFREIFLTKSPPPKLKPPITLIRAKIRVIFMETGYMFNDFYFTDREQNNISIFIDKSYEDFKKYTLLRGSSTSKSSKVSCKKDSKE